jgi:beta propeller repeat protein
MSTIIILLVFSSVGSITPIYRAHEFSICTNPGVQRLLAISGDIVVWQDNRNGNWDIYGYDLSTGKEFPICDYRYSQCYPQVTYVQENPGIFSIVVVWYDDRGKDIDIYGAKLETYLRVN